MKNDIKFIYKLMEKDPKSTINLVYAFSIVNKIGHKAPDCNTFSNQR